MPADGYSSGQLMPVLVCVWQRRTGVIPNTDRKIPDTWSMAEMYSDVYLYVSFLTIVYCVLYNWYLFVQKVSMEIVYCW